MRDYGLFFFPPSRRADGGFYGRDSYRVWSRFDAGGAVVIDRIESSTGSGDDVKAYVGAVRLESIRSTIAECGNPLVTCTSDVLDPEYDHSPWWLEEHSHRD